MNGTDNANWKIFCQLLPKHMEMVRQVSRALGDLGATGVFCERHY